MEEVKKEEAPKSEIDGRIERANAAAERLEKAEAALAAREASLKEAEAVKRLGGQTEGRPQEVTKVETAKEYSERVMKGQKVSSNA